MGGHHTRERVGARRPALSRCAFLVEKTTKTFATQPRERQLAGFFFAERRKGMHSVF